MEGSTMGEIVRRGSKENPRYYLRFTDENGIRRMKAAKGATTATEARKLLAAIEYRVSQGQVGIVVADPEAGKRASVTVKEIGELFLANYSRPKLKDPASYRQQVRSVLECRVYPTLGDRAASSITADDIDNLRDTLSATYAPGTVKLTLANLSTCYSGAHRLP
jgi:hypothetical protein